MDSKKRKELEELLKKKPINNTDEQNRMLEKIGVTDKAKANTNNGLTYNPNVKNSKSALQRVAEKISDMTDSAVDWGLDKSIDLFTMFGNNLGKSIFGIGQSILTQTAKDLQEGQSRKTSEKVLNTSNPLLFSSLKSTKDMIDTIKNKDKTALEKGVNITTKSVSNALSSILPTRQLTQAVGSVLPKSIVEKASNKLLETNEKIQKNGQDKFDENLSNTMEGKKGAEKFVYNAVGSVGQMTPSIIAGAFTGGSSVATLGTMYESVKGQKTNELLEQGKTLNEAIAVGDTSGAIEVGTELLTGGVNIFGKGAFDDIVKSGIDKKVTNEVLNFLAKKGYEFAGEVTEETISDLLGTLIDKGTINPDASYSVKDWGETAVTTILSTAILNTLTGGYSSSAYEQSTQELNTSKIQNMLEKSSLEDNVKNLIVETAEKNNLTTEQVEKLIEDTQNGKYDENSINRIDVEQILENNQQTIQEESKMAQNQFSNEIRENDKIFQESAQKYNIDTENNSVKNIKQLADKTNNVLEFSDKFNNEKILAKYEDGKITINVKADTQKALENMAIHEAIHSKSGTEGFDKLVNDVLKYSKTKGEYAEAFEDLRNIYSEQYKNMTAEQFDKLINEEVVTNTLGEYFGTEEKLVEMINNIDQGDRRNFIQKAIDLIKDIINNLTGYRNEQQYFKKIQRQLENVLSNEEVNGNLKNYSIQTDNNGNKYVKVDTDQNIFEGKSLKEQKLIAKQYILDNFREKGVIKDNENISISRKTANEYTNPKTKLPNKDLSNKVKASTELDNLLNVSEYKYSKEDDGRHIFANNGWDYYEATFQIGDKTYTGILNVAKGNKGKLLYDITNIKERANNISVKTESVVNSSTNNSISSLTEEVNTINNNSTQNIENNTQKERQLEIIKNSNPMVDDYHTGIRTVDDIKTFEEAIQDKESFVYGDYSLEKAKSDLEKGTVTVYSSKPIEQGAFVSTSKNMAKDYAGNGKIYSQEVNIDDVAWINGDEGQYAKVDNSKYAYQSNGAWQSFVDKYFKSEGSKTTIMESKLPERKYTIEDYKNVLDKTEYIPEEEKNSLLKEIENVKINKDSLKDFSELVQQMEDVYKENSIVNSDKIVYNTNESEGEINESINREGIESSSKERITSGEENGTNETVKRGLEELEQNIKRERKQSREKIDEVIRNELTSSLPVSKNKSNDIIKEIKSIENITTDGIKDILKKYNSYSITNKNEDIKKIREIINSYSFYINDNVKNDLKYNYGKLPRNIKYSENGTPIDTFYKELQNMFPETFSDEIINESDIASTIIDFMKNNHSIEKIEVPNILDEKEIEELSNLLYETSQQYQEIEKYYEEQLNNIKYGIDPGDNNNFFDDDLEAIREASKKGLGDIMSTEEQIQAIQESTAKELSNKLPDTSSKIVNALTKDKKSIKEIAISVRKLITNKGAVVDDLFKTTGNKEGTWAYDRYLGSFAEGQVSIGINQINSNGEVVGASLLDIYDMAKKNGITQKILDDYVLNKDNIARSNYEKSIYGEEISAKDSQKIIDEYDKKYPELKNYAGLVSSYANNDTKSYLVGSFISEDLYNKLRKMYPDHVPVVRDISETVGLSEYDNIGSQVLKRAKGGNQEILSPKEALAQQSVNYVRAFRKNEALKEVYKSIKSDTKILYDLGEIIDIEQANDCIKNAVSYDESLKKYTATIFENGEAKIFEISKDVYDAFSNDTLFNKIDNAFGKNIVGKGLSKATKTFKGLTTGKNILYALKNMARDINDAPINSTTNFANYMKDWGYAYEQIVNNGKYYQEYVNAGGTANTFYDYDKGIIKKDFSSLPRKAIDVINKNTIGIVEQINEVVETAPRLAEYIATRQRGGSINEALYNSAEVTTNFKRGGELTKFVDKYGVPYLNASVQGLSKVYRNISGANGFKGYTKLAINATLAGILPSLINHLVYDDDDEYEELPDYIKDGYYLIKVDSLPEGLQKQFEKWTENNFIRIPKGRISAVLGDTAVRMYETIQGKDDVWDNYVSDVVLNNIGINNPLTNNLFSPLLFQASNNKAWYGGTIYSETKYDNMLPVEITDEKTTKLSNWVASTFYKMLGEEKYKELSSSDNSFFKVISTPKLLDYVLDQYSGFVGDIIMPMLTPYAENNALVDQFTTSSTLKSTTVSKFYEMINNCFEESAYATDTDKLTYKYLNSVSKEVGELYGEKSKIQSDETLTNKQKQQLTYDIQKQINSKMQETIDKVENLKLNENTASFDGTEYYKDKDGNWKVISEEDQIEGLSTEAYAKYTNTISKANKEKKDSEGKQLTDKEKIKILNDGTYSDKEKTLIYENIVGKNDSTYQNLKLLSKNVSINAYLDYKQQDIKGTEDKNSNVEGKTISGSKKENLTNYLKNSNLSNVERCYIKGRSYKLNGDELKILENAIDKLSTSEQRQIYESLTYNFEVWKDGTIHYK